VLDFDRPNLSAPLYSVPFGPFGAPCPSVEAAQADEWTALKARAQSYGWPLP
jgi:hypothetical protein